jgi:hypothetical protein
VVVTLPVPTMFDTTSAMALTKPNWRSRALEDPRTAGFAGVTDVS